MASTLKKLPIHPLFFSLSPLLYLLVSNTNPVRLIEDIRTGGLFLAGGLVLYGLFWLITRHPLRAALLASLCLLFIFIYDPLYEVVRGRDVFGWTYGRHRFLAPPWAGLLAASGFAVVRKLERPQRLTRIFNVIGLVMLVFGVAGVLVTGMWYPTLRAVGLLPAPHLEVTFIDVGHVYEGEVGVVGESILLQTAEGKTALIDGGYPNSLVLETLQARGIDHLDLVVATHPDDDHTGGLINVVRALPVDLLVHNGQTLNSPIFEEFDEAIREAEIPTQVVRSGDLLAFGTLTFEVLNPRSINESTVNTNSIVLRLVCGRVPFLFTGDTDRVAEMRLYESGNTQWVDILKIAHHGGDSSSLPEYIAAISPEIAIYSVGPDNIYDFPHDVTLETMRAVGAQVYGTDVNGTIVVRTDGKTYEVLPERGEPR